MATTKNRVMIQMNDEQKEYVVKTSEELGVSISGLINVIISQHRKQNEAMEVMSDIGQLVEELKKITGGQTNDK